MSRLKRQRLGADGQDRVTLIRDDPDTEGPSQERGISTTDRVKQQQGRSLFVRSLPASMTSERLADFFSESFPIKHATIVVDPTTKVSKGYGFVTFADVEDAHNAKETFGRSLFDGQKIKVEVAEPRHRQVNDDLSGSITQAVSKPKQYKPDPQSVSKLIVRNLPWSIKAPDQLTALFRSYGKVKHTTLPKKKQGQSAGYGFVVLRGRKNAEKALEGVNGTEIGGRTLAVDWAVEKNLWENLQDSTQQQETQDQTPASVEEDQQEEQVVTAIGALEDLQKVESLQNEMILPKRKTTSDREERNADDFKQIKSASSFEYNSSTLFIRNLPFNTTDESLRGHFSSFGPVRYSRAVLDHATGRPKGTGFVCFYEQEDANSCLRGCPQTQPTKAQVNSSKDAASFIQKQSLLEDTSMDPHGHYTVDGRILQITKAVDRTEAARLTIASAHLHDVRDKDKRKLYLLSEGTIPVGSTLYEELPPSDIRMREDSAKQRQSLVKSNPALHLSLTRLSVRNIPRTVTSTELKALAREAVVGFAKDVKAGLRTQLSKEEEVRGGESMREAERSRKSKGKGIVKQAKIVFEGREGGKVTEDSGAGRSRGYGFIEYSSHRWALMGLRWLNGHILKPSKILSTPASDQDNKKRLIVEFAIENAQVVGRRLEREAKARERSKLVHEKQQKGEIAASASKPPSRDQLMAKTRKGAKRKREAKSSSTSRNDVVPSEDDTVGDIDRTHRRQQIIGRKRMLRRSKKSG